MASTDPRGCTTLIGGVGQLFQGDLDLGRLAAEQLAGMQLGPLVSVEELHYGAVAVAQRIEELGPRSLILIGAEPRGRSPGSVERRRVKALFLDNAKAQGAVVDATGGYVSIDLVVEVAYALGVLPARTVTIEVEPEDVSPGRPLSPVAAAALAEAVRLAHQEAARQPLFELSDRLESLGADPARLEPGPGVEAVLGLLGGIHQLEDTGSWGDAFRWRDRLRRSIAEGGTGAGMEHLDWALWWALIEEIDRLETAEAIT